MYRIFNYLFGWDYIHWSNSADSGIARRHKDYDGYIYYWRYRSTTVMDIIHKPEQVTWLTCRSDKYFYKEEK